MNNNEKKQLIKKHSPPSPLLKNAALSFTVGGFICSLGEALLIYLKNLGVEEKNALTLVTVSFIVIGSALTALGIFDRIARHAGAGTLVPVTGFSNAVTSQAMDAKNEGLVLGVGAKIFTVAGPVILYGTASGVIFGVIYYILMKFGVLGA
jgi:stage V sporulation protein AC